MTMQSIDLGLSKSRFARVQKNHATFDRAGRSQIAGLLGKTAETDLLSSERFWQSIPSRNFVVSNNNPTAREKDHGTAAHNSAYISPICLINSVHIQALLSEITLLFRHEGEVACPGVGRYPSLTSFPAS